MWVYLITFWVADIDHNSNWNGIYAGLAERKDGVVIESVKVPFANQADYILVRVSIKSELLSDEELLERRTSKADSECPLYLQVEVNSR